MSICHGTKTPVGQRQEVGRQQENSFYTGMGLYLWPRDIRISLQLTHETIITETYYIQERRYTTFL